MNLRLVSPFPLNQLSKVWEWHSRTKALTARLGRENFIEEFTLLITHGLSWGLQLDGELIGIVVLEPTMLPGDDAPSDGAVHIAVARKAWGKGVIQMAAHTLVPTVFRAVPSLRRLTAWTVESNYPARAVAESLGFQLEGQLRNAVTSTQGVGEALLLYGFTQQGGLNGIGS